MAALGQFNQLPIAKFVDFGAYLDAGDMGEILLPKRYLPEGLEIGDTVDVFLYLDSEDTPIATTEKPLVTVGRCAVLKVTDVNKFGAFLDWGLMKDLMVPFGEQVERMQVGKSYLVTAYIEDRSGRIVASNRLEKHLSDKSIYHKAGQPVEMIVIGETPLGYKVVVDQHFMGLLYRDEAPRKLKPNEQISGYVKEIRPDGKLDLSMRAPRAQQTFDALSEKVLEHLRDNGGRSTITDTSSPEEILKVFGTSKGKYKKTIGHLFKQGVIKLTKDEISLV